MATSQNGWPLVTKGLESLPGVTGRALAGPVWVVLYWLVRSFAAKVEPVTKAWSWGYSYRRIAGSRKWSNHASGTAVDLNAPKHPAGKVGTFTGTQVAAIGLILAASQGVLRWGREFRDEMHFEVSPHASPAQVHRLAVTILQVELAGLGIGVGPAGADGILGHHTAGAIRTAAGRAGLPAGTHWTSPKFWAGLDTIRTAQTPTT